MTLPKIDIPRYSLYLKGIDKKIKYRPFTVKEQKILMLAKEEAEGDKNRMIESMKQIVELCTFDLDMPVDDVPLFDIEMLFLHIRSKAVSDVITIPYKYTFESGNTKKVKLNINVDEIQLKEDPNHSKKVILDEENGIGVMMKYPSISMYEEDMESMESIVRCIDYVFDAEDVFYFKDYTPEERTKYVDDFDLSMLKKVSEFFETMPKLSYETKVVLKDDPDEDGNVEEKEFDVKLEGLTDFFM